MAVDIVKYMPHYRDGVIELQRYLWSTDAGLASAHLAWKYECNPYASDPMIYLAVDNDRVVGMRGIYGARWLIGATGEILPALGAGDLVIAPEHRGKGLFRDIMAFAEDDVRSTGFRYLVNLSASPATYIQSVRMGWHDGGAFDTLRRQTAAGALTGRMRMLLGRARHASALRAFLERSAPARPAAARRFAALERHARVKHGAGPIVLEHAPRAAEMAALVARIGSDGRVRHLRDEGYFAWRFRNPLSLYRFLYWQESQLEGYLVLEMPHRALRNRVRIVDWQAAADEVRESLLHSAVEGGRFADLGTWSATLPRAQVRALEAQGFRALPAAAGAGYRHALLIKDLCGGPGGLPDIDGWDLRMSDSDKC